MAPPTVPEAKLLRAVELMNEAFAAGFEPGRGAAKEAAKRGRAEGLLTNPNQIFDYIQLAEERLNVAPDESLWREPRYQQPVARLHMTPAPEPAMLSPSGVVRRHLFIPDEHNDPRHPHRLAVQTWVARYGSEHRHDVVIKAGDSGTFDSVSRHDRDDTLRGRLKPSIRDDLANHRDSLAAFERGRDPDWRPKKKKARGNHEQRLWDYENQNPASAGTHTLAYEEHLLQFGWQERPFGEIFNVDGVNYTHCPMNGMGRPMGGKTAPHRAGAMSTAPMVYGHTHKFSIFTDPKFGATDRVMIVEGGCSLPYGEVERYAMHNPTGWSYGVVDLSAQGGQIIDIAFVSMLTLRSRYSDDGADIHAA